MGGGDIKGYGEWQIDGRSHWGKVYILLYSQTHAEKSYTIYISL